MLGHDRFICPSPAITDMQEEHEGSTILAQIKGYKTQNLLMGIDDQSREVERSMIPLGPPYAMHNPSQSVEKFQTEPPLIIDMQESTKLQDTVYRQLTEQTPFDTNQPQTGNPAWIHEAQNCSINPNKIAIQHLLPLFQLTQFHATQSNHLFNSTNINPTLFQTHQNL